MTPKFGEFLSKHCCLKKFTIFTAPAGNPRLFVKWQRRSIRKTSPAFVISQRRLPMSKKHPMTALPKLWRQRQPTQRSMQISMISWTKSHCLRHSSKKPVMNVSSFRNSTVSQLNPIEMVSLNITSNLFYTKIPLFSTGDGSSTDIVKFKRRHSKMRRMLRWLRSTHVPLMSLGNSSIALGGLWMLIGIHSPEKPQRGKFASRRVTAQFPRGQWCTWMPSSIKIRYLKCHWFLVKIWPTQKARGKNFGDVFFDVFRWAELKKYRWNITWELRYRTCRLCPRL